jgi:hypothetical protein
VASEVSRLLIRWSISREQKWVIFLVSVHTLHAHLAAACTPVVRIADEATIARYVERLGAVLATGTANNKRAFLRP